MNRLKIEDAKMFKLGAPFEKEWYKQKKCRLGKLYHAVLKRDNSTDK